MGEDLISEHSCFQGIIKGIGDITVVGYFDHYNLVVQGELFLSCYSQKLGCTAQASLVHVRHTWSSQCVFPLLHKLHTNTISGKQAFIPDTPSRVKQFGPPKYQISIMSVKDYLIYIALAVWCY